MKNIDYTKLRSHLFEAIHCFHDKLMAVAQIQYIYAIGLYVNDEFGYISPTANSTIESGLFGGKWSPPDWKYHLFSDECFEDVKATLLVGWNEDYSEYRIDREKTIQICIEVLAEFRKAHFEESDVVVGIFMGGMGDKIVISSVQRLNPTRVYETFVRQLFDRSPLDHP